MHAPPDALAWRERVRARLFEIGFDSVRFTDVAEVPADRLRAWIDAGHHADMEWIARGGPKRADPALVLQGARALVMLGVNYLPETASSSGTSPRWARYAQWSDYHDTVLAGLRRAANVLEQEGVSTDQHRYYVDTGPLLERGWAARAGIGFLGKNAMLISREHGNWLFLAAILLAREVPPDPPLGGSRAFDEDGGARVGLHCGSCTRCMDACPTSAFPRPGVVDARRCVSYQTIENKGVIPRELRRGIGERIYGCDTCLEVCPWNRFARAGRAVLLEARPEMAALPLETLLGLDPESFARHFRGTAIKRVKLRGILRNACIVAGNRGDSALLPRIEALCTHAEPLVRTHAVWAHRRLSAGAVTPALRALLAREQDPLVLAELEGEA